VGSQVDPTHRDERDSEQQKSDGGFEPYSPLRHDQRNRDKQPENHDRDDDVTARKRSETGPDQRIQRARTIDDQLDDEVDGYTEGEHDRNRVGKRPTPTPQDCGRYRAEHQGHTDRPKLSDEVEDAVGPSAAYPFRDRTIDLEKPRWSQGSHQGEPHRQCGDEHNRGATPQQGVGRRRDV